MQAQQPETTSDQGRVREPVLTIEELGALTERLGLILRFSPEALHDVGITETWFERGKRRRLVRCQTNVTPQVRDKGLCHANTEGIIRQPSGSLGSR
jgi:hypothetical protein